MNRTAWVIAVLVILGAGGLVRATTVQELVRIKGQGESVIRGLGIVVGLPGTGDSGKELALARPLAEFMKNNGNAIASLKDLQNSKSAALVVVMCTIPPAGAVPDDRIDVTVSVVNSASSLKGGRLLLVPLLGPLRTDDVYAFAEGAVDLEDVTVPTTGRVRGGARIVKSTREAQPDVPFFDLIIESHFAGMGPATQIANSIDVQYQTDPNAMHNSIATVVDDRTIRVTIPVVERPKRAAFMADVLGTPVNVALLGLPAQVVCNQRSGAIIVTGEVEISPGIITHKDLVISTMIPTPVPTAQDPQLTRSKWLPVGTDRNVSESQNARLADLLGAFKQLDIPVQEQISILQMLSKAGRLRAKLIVD